MGKNDRVQSYVSAPADMKPRKAPKRGGRKRTTTGMSTGFCIAGLIGFGVYLFAFGGLEYLQDLGNEVLDEFDDSTPTGPPVVVPTFPEIVREDDNYVGLVFLNGDFNDANILDAFLDAAQRWSEIVNNTDFTNFELDAGDPICPGSDPDPGFNVTTTLTHLVILTDIVAIDGPSGILGSAGPCRIPLSNSRRPVTGSMQFDIADLQDLASENSLEAVVLHEMGHVLGIGTLFSTFNLIQDPVFTGSVATNLNVQPKFVGANGVAEYSLLTGNSEAFIPVEDGFSDAENRELFDRSDNEGRGSIDGHWDNDFMNNELMEFQINQGTFPPLSRVSIASLIDYGYTVDLDLADDYSIPTNVQSTSLRGAKVKKYSMINDIDLSGLYLD